MAEKRGFGQNEGVYGMPRWLGVLVFGGLTVLTLLVVVIGLLALAGVIPNGQG